MACQAMPAKGICPTKCRTTILPRDATPGSPRKKVRKLSRKSLKILWRCRGGNALIDRRAPRREGADGGGLPDDGACTLAMARGSAALRRDLRRRAGPGRDLGRPGIAA